MRYLFLAVFILVSLVHLYASFIDNKKLRAYTKGAILLSLLGYYVLSSGAPNWFIIGALVFSLLGDVALIFDGWFAVGGICFMISHFCFIGAYAPQIDLLRVPWYVYPLIAAVYAVPITLLFRSVGGHLPKKLYPPMLGYLIVNGLMNCAAFLQLVSRPCLATALVYAGAALFFASDCTLFMVRFHKTKKVWRNHFPVMLTYIAGEFLIVQGMLLLLG